MQQDDRIFAAVFACVVAAAALTGTLMWFASGITVEAPQRATLEVQKLAAPTPTTAGTQQSMVVEAAYDPRDGDSMVRRAVATLSSHPEFTAYLVNDRLLTRFVLSVDAIAGGYSPRDELEFLRPHRAFVVREDEGRLVIAAGSYRRYRLMTDVFSSFDTAAAASLYRRFRPELESIYREVGWASDDFDSRLHQAIDHLLEVSVPAGPIEVEQRAIVYAYADDEFENLTESQKLLLRLGADNAARIQQTLREFRATMGWPDAVPVVTAERQEDDSETLVEEPLIAEVLETEPLTEIMEPTGLAQAP
mgnify:CR=1 FL=1